MFQNETNTSELIEEPNEVRAVISTVIPVIPKKSHEKKKYKKYESSGTKSSKLLVRDIEFANKHIQGMDTLQIAKEAGMSRQGVQKRLTTPDVKDYIEKAQKRIISTCLEPAIENMEWLVQNYKSTQTDKNGIVTPVLSSVEKEHSFKMHMPILEIAGVKPLPYQSQFIQNIYQDNKNVLILPVIEEALTKYVDSFKLISNEDEGSE